VQVSTLLVTWNPDKSYWVSREHKLCCEAQEIRAAHYSDPEGERFGPHVVTNWNTQTFKDVRVGDKVLMLMQGGQGRGIIRDGIVTKEPYEDPNWDRGGTKRIVHYVDVMWLNVVTLDNPLRTSGLKDRVPEVNWNMPFSGLILEDAYGSEVASKVERLWLEHLEATGIALDRF
jgi:hypothetical protein